MAGLDFQFGMHVISDDWMNRDGDLATNAPGHADVTALAMLDLAARNGASIVRVPLSLADIGANNPVRWQYLVDDTAAMLQAAAARGVKVILEPGQTPADLRPAGSVNPDDAPETPAKLQALAHRFALFAQSLYAQHPDAAGVIAAWEVGNEPNLSYTYTNPVIYGEEGDPTAPRFFAVHLDNAQAYGEYLAAVALSVHRVRPDAQVIAAGVAHNDQAYLNRMMQTLHGLQADIDGFSLHPYTIYDWPSPQSGRPTDRIAATTDDWNFYHSFQGGLASMDAALTRWGYGDAGLWITEFGVPSWLGYRSAGPEGRADQARWFAEALGILEAWGKPNLKAVVAHMVLDTELGSANDRFDAYASDGPGNDGDTERAEGAFALFERMQASGPITAKPVVAVTRAIAEGADYDSAALRIVNHLSTGVLDLSGRGSTGIGLTAGYIALTHAGHDRLTGSRHADSLFSGSGADLVQGGAGDDRIFAGSGRDTLYGGAGRDNLMGGAGNDRIFGGNQADFLSGGHGRDVLVGGLGNDTMAGGAGADRFVFRVAMVAGDFGEDQITDFRGGPGLGDVLQIDHRWGYADAAAVISGFTDTKTDKVLIIDANTTITLLGLAGKTLVTDDILVF